MNSKLVVLVLLGLVSHSLAHRDHPVREEIVEKIKQLTTAWTPREAHLNSLRDVPVDMLSMKLGHIQTASTGEKITEGLFRFVNKLSPKQVSHKSKKVKQQQEEDDTVIPDSFDAREKWPDCIHDIRNQQLCGSCWAFASSGFLSDRFCIHSDGDINLVLAPQDLVACSFENFGCNGGQLVNTVDYLLTEGVVSEACMPYQNQDTLCGFKCINQAEKYTKYFCKPDSLTILSDQKEIQKELMTNGPMMVGLTVYEDFMNYEKGIYEYTTGVAVGGHAIKIIGWGTDERGVLYWVCQNQWGSDWGEKGFINIRSGQLGLDSMVIGCMPDIEE